MSKKFSIVKKDGRLDLIESNMSQLFKAEKPNEFHKSINNIFKQLINDEPLIASSITTLNKHYFREDSLGITAKTITDIKNQLVASQIDEDKKRVGLWVLLILSIYKLKKIDKANPDRNLIREVCEELIGIVRKFDNKILNFQKVGAYYDISIDEDALALLNNGSSKSDSASTSSSSLDELLGSEYDEGISTKSPSLPPPPPPYSYDLRNLEEGVKYVHKLLQQWQSRVGNQGFPRNDSFFVSHYGEHLFFQQRLFRDRQINRGIMDVWKKLQQCYERHGEISEVEQLLNDWRVELEVDLNGLEEFEEALLFDCKLYEECLANIDKDFSSSKKTEDSFKKLDYGSATLVDIVWHLEKLKKQIEKKYVDHPDAKTKFEYNPELPPPLPPRRQAKAAEEDKDVEVFSKKDSIKKPVSSQLVISNQNRMLMGAEEGKIMRVKITSQFIALFVEQIQQLEKEVSAELAESMAVVLRREMMMRRVYEISLGMLINMVQQQGKPVFTQQILSVFIPFPRAIQGEMEVESSSVTQVRDAILDVPTEVVSVSEAVPVPASQQEEPSYRILQAFIIAAMAEYIYDRKENPNGKGLARAREVKKQISLANDLHAVLMVLKNLFSNNLKDSENHNMCGFGSRATPHSGGVLRS